MMAYKMKSIAFGFMLSIVCSAIALFQSLTHLGGVLGLVLGLSPLAVNVMLLPFAIMEESINVRTRNSRT